MADAVRAQFDQSMVAFNAGNLDEYAKNLDEDAIMWSPNGATSVGKQAIKEGLAIYTKTPDYQGADICGDIRVVMMGENWAQLHCTSTLKDEKLKTMMIFRKDGDDWLINRDLTVNMGS